MKSQSLGNNEILNIRWANEDPNPVAKAAAERANADAVVAAVKAAGHSIGPDEDTSKRPALEDKQDDQVGEASEEEVVVVCSI